MTLAAIENADDKELVDCSSIRFFASKRLSLSMAASFSAHVALAAYLATAISPHGINTAPSPDTFSITLVDLDAPVTARSTTAPRQTKAPITEKSAPDIEQKVSTPPAKPIVTHTPIPVAIKSPLPASAASTPLSPAQDDQSRQASTKQAAAHPVQAEKTGSLAAPRASAGQPNKTDLTEINEARYRTPPTPPRYPKRARELNQQGEALLHIRLNPDGNAEEILVWRSSGHVLLDNAALAAARRWEFEPERRGGRAVIAWVKIPVRFSLH